MMVHRTLTRTELAMPYADVDGNTIHYEEHGDPQAPLLVLLHGLYGDASTVRPLAEPLGARFRVVTPDALGHGRSARPAGFTLADQGRMPAGLIASFGAGPALVVGISMGSYLAAQLAALAPSRVARLALVVGKAHGTTSSVRAYAQRTGFDLESATVEETLAFMAGALWSPDTPDERRADILATQTGPDSTELSAEEKAAVEASLAGFDLRPVLPSITAPTWVVSGAADGLNPPESGRELARLIPHARFTVYEHSGHMLAYEETGRLVADLEAFLLG